MTRKNILLTLLGVTLTLGLTLTGVLAWLVNTDSGMQWTYTQIKARLPGTLEIETLEGNLKGPLELRQLRYQSDAADIDIRYIKLDVALWALLSGRVQIDELMVDRSRITLKPSRPAEGESKPFSLPFRMRIANARVTDTEVRRAGGAAFRVDSIEISARANADVLALNQLHVVADTFEFYANGALGLTRGNAERLEMRWRMKLPQGITVAGTGEAAGNLDDVAISLRLTEPASLSLEARVREALTDLQWQAQLTIPDVDVRRIKRDAPAARASLELTANGDRTRFETEGRLSGKLPNLPRVNGTFRARGDVGNNILLDALTLAPVDSNARLTLRGNYQLGARTWTLNADWRDLQWPLSGVASFVSGNGKLDASGSHTDYRLALNAALRGPGALTATLQANGNGDPKQFTIERFRVDTLGGRIDGSAHAAWSPTLRWNLRASAAALNPGIAWAGWPGALSLTANASGDARTLSGEITQLTGQLRGYAIRGNARLRRDGDRYREITAQLNTHNSEIALRGSITDEWNLAWHIRSPNLGNLIPQARGAVTAEGRIHGPRLHPLAQAEISGTSLGYGGFAVDTLTANAAVDTSEQTPSRVTVRGANASWNGRAFQQLILNAAGTRQDHRITASLNRADVSLSVGVRAQGDVRTRWNGVLERSALRVGTATWLLAGQPRIDLAPQRLVLEQSCWRNGNAHLCGNMRRENAETRFNVAADRFPLAMFGPLLAMPLQISGTITGSGEARMRDGRMEHARALLELSAGAIRLSGSGAASAFVYEQGEATLTADNDGLRANATLTLPSNDRVTANIALRDFTRPRDGAPQPIQGALQLAVADLGKFAALVPALSELRGSLRGDFTLSGTTAQPIIAGRANVENGSARVNAFGTRIEQFRLQAVATGKNEIQINGGAVSGGGELGIYGRLRYPPGRNWQAELRLAGAGFQVVDLREIKVFVSPDLRAAIAPGDVRVTGEILIPRASISRQSRDEVLQSSNDVIMVGDGKDKTVPARPWKITTEIRVALGNDVKFVGFGLNAAITGDLMLVDSPTKQLTTARGELMVATGEYEAFGQKLQLERGRLLFVGGPVNNPAIDARAVRHIDDVSIAVEVQGTLQSPKLSLSSSPPMNQTDALSYLLFGHAVDNPNSEQGQALAAATRALRLSGGERVAKWVGTRLGVEEVDIASDSANQQASLVLGKRLSPRLYINYSIGLFEHSNMLRIQYKLGKHWMFEVQSGTNNVGGDLLYTIER